MEVRTFAKVTTGVPRTRRGGIEGSNSRALSGCNGCENELLIKMARRRKKRRKKRKERKKRKG